MNFSVADKHVHPSPYLSPKPRVILIASEDLNSVSLIAKLKNSAFKRYFTIPCFSAYWIFAIF